MQGGDFIRFMLDINEETSTLLKFDIFNLDEEIQSCSIVQSANGLVGVKIEVYIIVLS